jgi:hypothetical protein
MSEEENRPEYEVIEDQDFKDAPSEAKIPDIRASGHCQKCGRYTAVPVIDGAPQCKCVTG